MASPFRPLQDLEVVVTILGSDLVRNFYHGVIGREGEVDEFEDLHFEVVAWKVVASNASGPLSIWH